MVDGSQEVAEQREEFDFESIVLRRADPDDFEEILQLVEIGTDDIYNRVYSFPNILKLIETAYLAITVIDRDGRVVAFAVFEDHPQGMRGGMQDDRHFNYWEEWFRKAYNIDEFSAFNTLWLTYFICGGSLGPDNQHFAFKQILQTVYTSNPDLVGVLFLARGDADHEDIVHCLGPIQFYFGLLNVKEPAYMQGIRGIHKDSHIYFSPRLNVLPFIEIRLAKQEDHDDLADVFNSQSETITEAYGEYFIAELIAAQNESNRALVAQVKDKAVGLMGLTKEVDLKLLHKCFDLDPFDNLLKADFMDAIRARRNLIKAQIRRKQDNAKIEKEIRRRHETLKCHLIAQRMALQEHLLRVEADMFKMIEDIVTNEEEYKKLDKATAIADYFDVWLNEFEIANPTSDFFLNPENEDETLTCNIQSKLDFMLRTLEIFGLPKRYIDGEGHHTDWEKRKTETQVGKGKKKGKNKPSKGKSDLLQKMKQDKVARDGDKNAKPTYFDMEPVRKALKNFLAVRAEVRSNVRTQLMSNQEQLMKVFKDDHEENSFKRCVHVNELAGKLQQAGLSLDPQMAENLRSILICFGEIALDEEWGERVPPETEEQRKAKMLLEMRRNERAKQQEGKDNKKMGKTLAAEELEKKRREEEDDKRKEEELLRQMKPSKPIQVLLSLTSVHDLLLSVDRMAKFDRLLSELRMTEFEDFSEEDQALEAIGKPWEQDLQLLPEIEEHRQYSNDPSIQAICERINDLTTIPDPPESAKNAFAITLFCMEAAVDSRSKDFLKYAFDLFPDRDYLIVTQPHTVPENALLSKFTLVPKTMQNTFSHVLYLIHRDYLLEQDVLVQRTLASDFEQITDLLVSTQQEFSKESPDQIMSMFQMAAKQVDSPWLAYTARVEDSVIAAFLISKDVNLNYYVSHFHIQDQILMAEHDPKGHSRLIYSVINPIFEKSTRFLLKELLRLSGKTCLYFETNVKTVIPTIFHELVHIRSRRFPHFLDRKWDHARYDPQQEEGDPGIESVIPVDGKDRDPLDEAEAPFALCFTTKRLLSEPKILKNSRVVVVGASDTGISFVEALMSISYLDFSNITLISPGGLPHHHVPEKKGNLKAYSTSYTSEELRKLMLESRIQVVDARMTDIDRSDKNIILHNGRVIPYDTLVLAMGIQDQTLDSLKYISQGIQTDKMKKKYRQCSGVLSIDDPYLYKCLGSEGPLMRALTDRRRTTNCVIYGRTLHTYALVQGLLNRGVSPSSIIMCVPEPQCHMTEYDASDPIMQEDLPVIYPNAYEDENIELKIQLMLEEMGITIYKQVKLAQIITDKDKEKNEPPKPAQTTMGLDGHPIDEQEEVYEGAVLERLLFKKLNEVDDEEEEDEDEDENRSHGDENSNMGGVTGGDGESAEGDDRSQNEGVEHHEKRKRRKKNELEIEARVLVTCGHRDVDSDVFKSIHDNGLVYNGRLIVDRNFQTTDPSIFAAGSLCEFSNRYKALSQGRSLRMDRYNGREMGSRLARSVFDIHDPYQPGQDESQQQDTELPLFFLPQGQGGVLPNDIIYYHIKTTNPLILKPGEQEVKNRSDLVCDNLDTSTGKGHFIKFTFNSIGLIDSVTYMGSEEIVLQSLWSFVGLHENYLNSLTERYENGIIPNAVEFLSENWAIALYHEWFGDFCLRMRQGIQGLSDVQMIIGHAFDKTSKERKGISREVMKQLSAMLEQKTTRMIEEETLEFIKTNMNHLPMYYIPGQEFK